MPWEYGAWVHLSWLESLYTMHSIDNNTAAKMVDLLTWLSQACLEKEWASTWDFGTPVLTYPDARSKFWSQSQAPDKSAYLNYFFLFLYQNTCFVYSKEPSQWDGSFEHPKHMFKLTEKKIITILGWRFLLNWPYESSSTSKCCSGPLIRMCG